MKEDTQSKSECGLEGHINVSTKENHKRILNLEIMKTCWNSLYKLV